MAKLNKLITYAYLKDEVDIPQNIPDEELENKVYRAQETLRMLMGDEFYQDYLTKYIASQFSTAYTSLYAYLKQYLAWQAYEFWVVMANFKPTRSGFRVHTEDNSVVATDTQMAMLIKDAKQRSQYYKMLMVEYLNGHSTDFELYNQSCSNDLTGNTFRISAITNRDRCSHDTNCRCRSCR